MKVLILTGNSSQPDLLEQALPSRFPGDKRLIKALQSEGFNVDNMRLNNATDIEQYQLDVSKYNFIINRFVNEDFDNSYLGLKKLHKLLSVKPVINSFPATQLAVNKFLCYKLFYQAGIKTPETVYAKDFNLHKDKKVFKGRLISKPNCGARGKGIQLGLLPEQIKQKNGIIVQPQIKAIACYRVLAADNKVIAVYKKSNKEDMFQGINPEDLLNSEDQIYQQVAKMGLAMHTAVGLFYSGSDILEDEAGELSALEINTAPGLPRQEDAEQVVALLKKMY